MNLSIYYPCYFLYKMIKVFVIAILAFCVIKVATTDTRCTISGYQDNPLTVNDQNSKAPCYMCDFYLSDCDFGDLTKNVFREEISAEAYAYDNSIQTLKCQSPHIYNPETKHCDNECARGCSACYGTTTFCTNCYPGFVWSEFTCTPALIGLQATTLAVMIISMVVGLVLIVRLGKRFKE